MSDSDSLENPGFLEYVYELNKENGLMEALRISLINLENIDTDKWKAIGLKTYADKKWSIHRIVQHLIDWERIWCFRAILFARKEGSIPEAHDQEIMGWNSNADDRILDDLIQELKVTRQSSIFLFESFNAQMLKMNCKFFEYQMPLDSIGLTITAHQIHHFNVIKEKYLPLLDQ